MEYCWRRGKALVRRPCRGTDNKINGSQRTRLVDGTQSGLRRAQRWESQQDSALRMCSASLSVLHASALGERIQLCGESSWAPGLL